MGWYVGHGWKKNAEMHAAPVAIAELYQSKCSCDSEHQPGTGTHRIGWIGLSE